MKIALGHIGVPAANAGPGSAWVLGTALGERFDIDLDFVSRRGWLDGVAGNVEEFLSSVRASSATYHDENGILRTAADNEFRYDHDPSTLAKRGLLVERTAVTNLLVQSEALGTTSSPGWGSPSGASVSSNSVVAPDGLTTADTFIEGSGGAFHLISNSLTANSSLQHTASIFVKAHSSRRLVLLWRTNAVQSKYIGARFDPNTGQISAENSGAPTSTITPGVIAYPNGWYRIYIGGVLDSGGSSETILFDMFIDNGSGTGALSINYSGDGASGVYLWGAQVEQNALAYPSSYIPTTTAQVTRAGDAYSVTNLGSITSRIASTLYVEGAYYGFIGATNAAWASVNIADFSDYLGLDTRKSDLVVFGRVLGLTNTGSSTTGASHLALTFKKMAMGAASNNVRVSAGGLTQGALDTSVDTFGEDLTVLLLGQSPAVSNDLTGWIKRVGYKASRLSDEQLETLVGN